MKKKLKKPTLRQAKAIRLTCENLQKNKPINMGKIMRESGYSDSVSKHPEILTKSKSWEDAMKGIDWAKHLLQLEELADTEFNQDKDNVLKSKQMLFNLGDKFPANKTKIVGLFDKIQELE